MDSTREEVLLGPSERSQRPLGDEIRLHFLVRKWQRERKSVRRPQKKPTVASCSPGALLPVAGRATDQLKGRSLFRTSWWGGGCSTISTGETPQARLRSAEAHACPSLAVLQAATDAAVARPLERRISPPTGVTVAEGLAAERCCLAPLPILPEPFDLVACRRVAIDSTVRFEGRTYRVPFAACKISSTRPRPVVLQDEGRPCSRGLTPFGRP